MQRSMCHCDTEEGQKVLEQVSELCQSLETDFSMKRDMFLKAGLEKMSWVKMCCLHANVNGLCYRPVFEFISLLLLFAGVLLCLHFHILPLILFTCFSLIYFLILVPGNTLTALLV